ncbi:hypothetical protein E0Z10_g9817 [Xylaria hypoxylon]|uniref:Uncharacterized protein n=1 Tax=Xylaria hypoxylon TaxID=37992 RepID=A0A4Z0YI13_9PEZI|nr:hypothetical protein E0Z10_g9817 [Xylaria hypoxylon]
MTDSYDWSLRDTDLDAVFGSWCQALEEQVEYSVRCDAGNDDYLLNDFFLDTLDSHGCIPIAFDSEAPDELYSVGQTDTMEMMKTDITTHTESLLREHLAQEASTQLLAATPNEPGEFIRTWSNQWGDEVTEIIPNCLAKVFTNVQCTTRTEDQSFGNYLESISSSSESRDAFFAILRRTVQAVTNQFLESYAAVERLSEHKDTFRDACERAIRMGLGDRAPIVFNFQPLSAEAETDTGFSILWGLALPGRFLGNLGSLIAAKVFNVISDDLKFASKQGFKSAFENYSCNNSVLVEELVDEVFERAALSNISYLVFK